MYLNTETVLSLFNCYGSNVLNFGVSESGLRLYTARKHRKWRNKRVEK